MQFFAFVRRLIILLPVRPSREKATSIPTLRGTFAPVVVSRRGSGNFSDHPRAKVPEGQSAGSQAVA
jgi:hypothetical protein